MALLGAGQRSNCAPAGSGTRVLGVGMGPCCTWRGGAAADAGEQRRSGIRGGRGAAKVWLRSGGAARRGEQP